jgi:hypothetical protein
MILNWVYSGYQGETSVGGWQLCGSERCHYNLYHFIIRADRTLALAEQSVFALRWLHSFPGSTPWPVLK